MKVITQEEFDNLPRNENGYKIVPSYSDLRSIREFYERCSFGERCTFGENCKLIGLKIICYKAIDRIGRSKRKLYCWNLEGVLYFQAGCFFGRKDELLERVEREYGKDSEYHMAIEFLEKLTIKLR